ncbi:hypothetical protein H5410_059453 [Solanum commersonii]|uniref:CCHC-type domain-containing protein n=1 Tax=Solanum commersonii TaxID=4109 RepID=A0A9J5W2T0_SOLCO|nr:hypothetical protein H5410_059453 [Solanum commersonii]
MVWETLLENWVLKKLKPLVAKLTKEGGGFVDVYVVHQISTFLIIEDPTEVQIAQLLTPKKGNPPPPLSVINVRADVSSPQPSDKNDTNIKEYQQPRVDKGKNKKDAAPKVSLEDLDEDEGQGQGNDFSSYHLHTSDESDVDVDAKQYDFESLYDVDKNIDDLSDLDSEFVEVRKSNIQEQVNKEKAARINIDEIPSGPVGIDAGFEDIYKNKRGGYEGKLGGDDLYFDSSDPDSDISEDEGDPIDSDEVVDPPARNSSTKVYFDPTANFFLFQFLLGEGIVKALLKYNKNAWCRELFKDHSKCDIVKNNMCETFNSWILAARFKSIITMLEEIRVKVMERMTQMREFSEKWITNVSPMAMQILTDNAKYVAICEVKFNGDNGYAIQHPPYKHVVNLKKKGIPCAYAITAMHYKDLDVESFVDHWYKKGTYLKGYSKFIQPMTNMKMWPKSTRPSIEPPKITLMPGRPRKKRSKDSDEPSKKKFGKATRKGRKMKCFLCRNFGHNKKGCPIAKNGYTTRIARTAIGETGGATTSAASTRVTGESGGATTSAASTGVTAGGSGGATTKRPITTSATFGGATTTTTTTGGSATNISVNFASVTQPTSQFSTQQSITSASSSKKSSKVKRGGANPKYKRPRTEKPRTTGFGVLFGTNGSVIERSGTTDRVLHSAPLKSSVPTNIDLGYKPNGLRWKGEAAVTQRQLQKQSYKRATQIIHINPSKKIHIHYHLYIFDSPKTFFLDLLMFLTS